MSQDGHILVTFGSVAEAAADTDSIAAQIEQQLSDPKVYLAPMIATWSGQASGNYQALQTKWNTSAEDLNLVLRQIAIALRTAQGNYQTAENNNQSVWG